MADLTKLIYNSNYGSFHQRQFFTGSVTIPSTAITTAGTIEIELGTITLNEVPDILDTQFNGTPPDDSSRPSDGWFRPRMGAIRQLGNSGAIEQEWGILAKVIDNVVSIRAVTEKTYYATFTPDATATVFFRLIDYAAIS